MKDNKRLLSPLPQNVACNWSKEVDKNYDIILDANRFVTKIITSSWSDHKTSRRLDYNSSALSVQFHKKQVLSNID